MDLKETNILGAEIENHWYYLSKAEAVIKLLKGLLNQNCVLDVGAGSAFFSRYLLKHTDIKHACCVDVNYDTDYDDTENGKVILFRRSIDLINADLVMFMDVLEHVDDDSGLLLQYINKVPDGCKFLISVPAFQLLWSGHDIFLEHKRRYTLNQLENLVIKSGLKLRAGNYYFGGVFPIVAIIRLSQNVFGNIKKSGSQLKKYNPLVNYALKIMCRAELNMMKINRIAGLTVFCVAEKV